jgi:hypothetical protein
MINKIDNENKKVDVTFQNNNDGPKEVSSMPLILILSQKLKII